MGSGREDPAPGKPGNISAVTAVAPLEGGSIGRVWRPCLTASVLVSLDSLDRVCRSGE
jgi:hypothetical protein